GPAAVQPVPPRPFAGGRRVIPARAGGWTASRDADSQGHEGRFYVWPHTELEHLLGDDAALAIAHWGVTAEGNFEGANILHVARPLAEVAATLGLDAEDAAARLERCRRVLFEARAPRERPGRDEKVLAAWNGLMLRAMAEGAFAFADDGLRDAALANGRFLRDHMMVDGRIYRSWCDGRAMIPGFLEDHAAVGLGFLALHELTGDGAWFDAARQLADATVQWFWDAEVGAFFDTAHDAERLVTRPRDVTDNAMPSGTSLAIELQLLMAERAGDAGARARATQALATLREPMRLSPLAFGHLLGVADRAVHGPPPPPVCGPDGCAPF
ncbi:MAG: thioredoxin domain-containing protein, partial [Gemmatimonadota bacterium]